MRLNQLLGLGKQVRGREEKWGTARGKKKDGGGRSQITCCGDVDPVLEIGGNRCLGAKAENGKGQGKGQEIGEEETAKLK